MVTLSSAAGAITSASMAARPEAASASLVASSSWARLWNTLATRSDSSRVPVIGVRRLRPGIATPGRPVRPRVLEGRRTIGGIRTSRSSPVASPAARSAASSMARTASGER